LPVNPDAAIAWAVAGRATTMTAAAILKTGMVVSF
jgi:hypothetical protein